MKKLSGWQKVGVAAGLGCGSIIGLLVLGAIVTVLWARSTVAKLGDPTPKKVERTIPLQEPVAEAPEGRGARSAATNSRETLRLNIDIKDADFTIRPGPPTGQVQVEGTYAPGLYELTEDREAGDAGRARRTTIRFRSKAPAWARMLGGDRSAGSSRPRVTLLIPAGVAIDLSLRVSQGDSHIDLGGLTLRELGLDLSMGNHDVDFKEPLAEGPRRLRLDTRMGNISIEHLGNARAQAIDTSGSMGNLRADLGGAWPPGAGADLSFTHSMGELTLRVPSAVRLEADFSGSQGEGKNLPTSGDETTDPKAPVLRMRVTTSMGDSRLTRY